MIVAVYARVSTSDQKCESQLAELTAFCAAHSWLIHDSYVDVASGSRADRPELVRLLEDARHHKFRAVLVWKLDRFGRSMIDLRKNVDSLKHWGIRFLATSQGIDTGLESGAAGNFLLNVLAAAAEFERELLRERTRAGVQTARRAGKVLGRPRVVVDKAAVERLRLAGCSIRDIAKRLGCGRGTIERCCPKIVPESGGARPLENRELGTGG